MSLKVESIQIKLDLIVDYLNELKPLTLLSAQAIIDDYYKYRAVERLEQLIVEVSLDIGRHLLKELYHIDPKENASVFMELARVGIISSNLGASLAKSASFRNILVHLYEKIDARKVIEYIPLFLRDFPTFVTSVNKYLEPWEKDNE